MGKTVKLIVGIVGVLILVVGIALVFLVSNLDAIVARAIETIGSDVTGVPVSVGGVEISLQEGKGTINRLTVGNPPGFGGGNAFELRQIALNLDVKNTNAELVTLSSVLVDGAKVNAVQTPQGNNLKAIQKNLDSDEPASQAAVDDGAGGTKLIIDDFRFQGGEISLEVPNIGEKTARVPDVRLTGIGRKSNGATATEAAKQILDPILRSAMQAMAGISREDLERLGREKLNEALGGDESGAAKDLGRLLQRGKD